jgi:hypothetical protein
MKTAKSQIRQDSAYWEEFLQPFLQPKSNHEDWVGGPPIRFAISDVWILTQIRNEVLQFVIAGGRSSLLLHRNFHPIAINLSGDIILSKKCLGPWRSFSQCVERPLHSKQTFHKTLITRQLFRSQGVVTMPWFLWYTHNMNKFPSPTWLRLLSSSWLTNSIAVVATIYACLSFSLPTRATTVLGTPCGTASQCAATSSSCPVGEGWVFLEQKR